jgi:hypothetical protein
VSPLQSPSLPRRYFIALAGFLAAVSFLKTLRLPNRWAATNFVLNYSQGFVRRGFVGELARRLLGDAAFHYWVFVVFAFMVMGGASWALVRLGRRARLAQTEADPGLDLAILVFLASPALVLLVHLVGYLDHLGLLFVGLFAAAGAAARRQWLAYGVAAAAGPVLALVHEAQTILFMPVVLFVLGCRALGAAQRSTVPIEARRFEAGQTVLALAGVLGIALGVSAYVSLAGDPQRVGALEHWLKQRADFTLHYGAFRALKTGSPVSLLDAMYSFWSVPGRLIWWFKALVLFLPSLVFLGVRGWRAIGRAESASPLEVTALRGLFLLSCLAPLSLNVVAWDYARWFALAVANALVCLLAFHVCCRAAPRRQDSALQPLFAAVVIALGLSSDAILFNNARVSYYPFFDQWQALGGLLQSGSLPSPPD